MFCKNCGKELPEDSKFCIYCGTKVEAQTEEIKQEIIEENIVKEEENLVQKEVITETVVEENKNPFEMEEKIEPVVNLLPEFIECSVCGAMVSSKLDNCTVCGALLNKNLNQEILKREKEKRYMGPKTKNGLATAGFIIGICAVVGYTIFPFCGVIVGLVGLILSIIGLVQIHDGKGSNKIFAILGICFCAYAMVSSIAWEFVLEDYMNQLIEEIEEMLESMGESTY